MPRLRLPETNGRVGCGRVMAHFSCGWLRYVTVDDNDGAALLVGLLVGEPVLGELVLSGMVGDGVGAIVGL